MSRRASTFPSGLGPAAKWKISSVVVAVAVVLLPSGCAADPQSAPNDRPGSTPAAHFLTTGKAAEEYRKTIAEIPEPLPTGVGYPPGLPAGFVPPSDEGQLEQGAARNQAWFTWLCAWETEYLNAFSSEDANRIDGAKAKIAKWPNMSFYENVMVDPTRGWVSNVVDPMNLDDPSGVKQDHDFMCTNFPTVPAK